MLPAVQDADDAKRDEDERAHRSDQLRKDRAAVSLLVVVSFCLFVYYLFICCALSFWDCWLDDWRAMWPLIVQNAECCNWQKEEWTECYLSCRIACLLTYVLTYLFTYRHNCCSCLLYPIVNSFILRWWNSSISEELLLWVKNSSHCILLHCAS